MSSVATFSQHDKLAGYCHWRRALDINPFFLYQNLDRLMNDRLMNAMVFSKSICSFTLILLVSNHTHAHTHTAKAMLAARYEYVLHGDFIYSFLHLFIQLEES